MKQYRVTPAAQMSTACPLYVFLEAGEGKWRVASRWNKLIFVDFVDCIITQSHIHFSGYAVEPVCSGHHRD